MTIVYTTSAKIFKLVIANGHASPVLCGVSWVTLTPLRIYKNKYIYIMLYMHTLI